jgi:PhnB protein
MAPNVKPIPTGFHSVTPYMVIKDVSNAIQFYKKAFGAQERMALPAPDGKIMHGEIQIGDSIIMMTEESKEMNALGPSSRGGSTGHILLYVDNVDTAFEKAVKAGCTVTRPLANQFWGDRYGQVSDPFGHLWSIATHVEDVAPEKMGERMAQAMKEMAAAGKN